MTTDYDAPRGSDPYVATDEPVEELKAHESASQSPVADVEVADTAESFELPGADLSGEELAVPVVPQKKDEFTCTSCFLVHHRSHMSETEEMVCQDCAE